MKRLIIPIFILLLLSAQQLRAEEINLTIGEAVVIALRDNRDILLKSEDVKKAKLKISEAQASLFPSLTFSGSWTRTLDFYDKDITQTPAQWTLKQDLYQGGKIINTIKYNGYNFEAAQAVLDRTKLELILNVRKAFYTLLLTRDFSELNKEILDNTKEHLEFLRVRYQYGQTAESDILSIEATLSGIQQAYDASLSQFEAAQALLNNLLYLEKGVKVIPQGLIDYEAREVAYDEAFLKALKDRPEIKQYAAQEKAAQKAIEIAKAQGRPSIYASWDYYSRSHLSTVTGLAKNWNDYSVIGLTFSWPIFDGWATKAKVEQAIVDLKETQLTREKVIKDIVLELKNAYLALTDALSKIKAVESDLVFYKDNLSSAGEKYKQGQVSLLGLKDAQLKQKVALFNQRQAAYDYLIAKSAFEKASGGM